MASHTVDILEEALATAKRAGLRVRTEWLDGAIGGLCRIGNQSWLFLDISLTATEQLSQVAGVLRTLELSDFDLSDELRKLVVVKSNCYSATAVPSH